jgi:Uma2 family endonuclease
MRPTVMAQPELEGHIVLEHISWDTYETLLEEIGERPIRLNYDNGTLEIMTLSFPHEHYKRILARLIDVVTEELNIPVCSGGSLTLKRKSRKKGMEADECWWITHAHEMRGKKRYNLKSDPPPDLSIEVDVTNSWLDRMAIAAAVRIGEVWHFDGQSFRFFTLQGGKYEVSESSTLFPFLPKAEIVRFLKSSDDTDETTLVRSFRKWVRETLVPAVLARRQNGDKSGSRRRPS